MKDLDFDELDRAVNSLMSNAGSDTSSEPKEKVVTIPTTVATHDAPQPSSATTSPTTSTQPDAAAPTDSMRSPASLAARRGGRFMDVVRPSSNMAPTAPNRVSREGVPIAAPTAPTATLPEPVTTHEPGTTPEVDQEAPNVSSWPDPLDFHKDTTAAADSTATATATAQPAETSSVESSDAQDPLQSPFLADAKVDKRPLGAFAASPNVAVDAFAAPPTTPDQPAATDETTQSEQQPVTPPTPAVLPDELKSDIVAIESDDGAVEIEKTEVTATIQPSVQPAAAATVSLGTTSIKQQYQEEPSTTPVEHAPIYDSEPYHQPLTHPAKKKSGWLVVLLIFLLLILGAGAGAAIYFYVL